MEGIKSMGEVEGRGGEYPEEGNFAQAILAACKKC